MKHTTPTSDCVAEAEGAEVAEAEGAEVVNVLKSISEQGNENGEVKLPVVIVGGGSIPRGTHPREHLKAMELPKEKGDERKVMRYSSTYRHTGLIGH